MSTDLALRAGPGICRYCNRLAGHARAIRCKRPECKKAFDRERTRAFMRGYRTTTGKRYGYEAAERVPCTSCGEPITRRVNATRCGPCARVAAAKRRHARAAHKLALAAVGHCGGVVWAAGPCRACGKPFAYPHPDAGYCSLACSGTRTEERARRRALLRQAYVAHVDRQAILERDGGRCQLCWLPIDLSKAVPHPLAATLDHIVPLVAGGTHEPANVQAAHFICNSRKSDRAPEQLSLLG